MKYWNNRADSYDNLDWARKEAPIKLFVQEACIDAEHSVIEVGCGTGKILQHVRAKTVLGIDISAAMCNQARMANYHKSHNTKILCDDFHNLDPVPGFDRVLMRMVLHHQMQPLTALKHIQKIMSPNGRFIVCEGIPPNDQLLNWFTVMFSHKEERLCWTENSLQMLLMRAGFKVIRKFTYETRASVKNWINNSGIPKNKKKKIWDMHVKLFKDEQHREAYKVQDLDGDFIVSFKFVGFYCAKEEDL